jgi:hypothetical protein
MSEVTQSPAEDSKQTVESQSITMEQFAARRFAAKVKPVEKPAEPKVEEKAEPKETETPEEPTPKEGGNEEVEETKGKDVLSQKDLSEFSDEEIAELAQKGKSGLLKRVAELTAKRKLAEERAAQLENALRQQNQNKPVEPKVENNPFAKIESVEDLGKKAQEITEVIEWAEDVLDRAEHLSHDDVAATVDGRQLTKGEVKQHLRDARRAKDKFIPAQQKELVAKAQRKQLREGYEATARKEFDWLSSSEDNDVRRQYQAMLSDPRIKPIEDASPEVAAQLPYILAHAANSMFARKPVSLETTPKVKPPSSPATGAAGAEKPESKGDRNVKERAKRFEENGSISDFVALRANQISKRSKI